MKHRKYFWLYMLVLVTVPTFASDLKWDNKLYNDGANEGAALAIAALISNTYGNEKTPFPVETFFSLPGNEETLKERLFIHDCVFRHVKNELEKVGGVGQIGYFDINNKFKKAFTNCGVNKINPPNL